MTNQYSRYRFSLLHADYVKLDKRWNYLNVISPYYRIYYIDNGEGQIVSGKEKIKLEPGFIYLVPSFTLCHLRCNGVLGQYFIHFFEQADNAVSLFENHRKVIKLAASPTDQSILQRLLEINPGRGINRSDNPSVYEKAAYYKSYQELNQSMRGSVYFETQGILLLLLARFMGVTALESAGSGPIPSKILDSIRYIQLNLPLQISVALLARRVNHNEDYFSRLFYKYTGQRPLPYIQEKRIERAQYLIATTSLAFTEIAERTGFESLSYFSKIFKRITCLTPGAYRRQQHL
ncbi:AraC family transcriptional regulator [Flavihumibacter sp. CACIAM 22H1]|uniref:helix-turn-helix domain-containing protein n=1 Tax=Flavihumibacter sp. CACIAM 22H1 TaxID=1812911 RepID=UPI0007A7FBCD|nr:AraC family transcriptional regulator [Flavihumibacter sp. CACIAM 22H1]KYP16263.1 MAG: regulator [Flavihumibacter sp. CACIAM 22H1]